jgi:cytoskeletal protein RodZ
MTLGETLKQKRKERNLSLKEVENGTSIRLNYLQAIEEGELNKLISPVYAQGFIRQYAVFLGLDSELIIRENPEIFNKQEKQEFSYGIGTLETRGNPGASVKWIPNAVWIVAFVMAVVAAWYFAKYLEVL